MISLHETKNQKNLKNGGKFMKNFKRTLAAALASAMMITPCIAAVSFEASAAGGTIFIENSNVGHTYTAYKIFDGAISASGEIGNPKWDNSVSMDAKDGKTVKQAVADLNLSYTDDNSNSVNITATSTVEEIIKALNEADNDTRDKFAEAVKPYLGASAGSATSSTDDSTVRISLSTDGFYLVEDTITDIENGKKPIARYILEASNDKSISIKNKRDYPTLEKKIKEGETLKDANTAAIGDVITYQLTSKVPDMTGYDTYFFNVSDTLDNGLTLNENSFTVTIGSGEGAKTLTNDSTANATRDDSFYVNVTGQSFKLVLEDFIQYKTEVAANTPITITYTATLNSSALINAPNKNTASLTYTNNPNIESSGRPGSTPDEPDGDDPTGETPGGYVSTYTTALKVIKIDGDTKDPMPGNVKFTLKGTNLNKVIVNTTTTFNKDNSGDYYKLKTGAYTKKAPADDGSTDEKYDNKEQKYSKSTSTETKTVTGDLRAIEAQVDEEGILSFTGLNAGTYTLTETDTPQGYNTIKDINFNIAASDVTKDSCTWSATSDDATITLNTANAMLETTIENNKGTTLPSTGGIGTTLFYVFGGLLAAGGTVVLVTKKRMAKEAK